jgi:hypothetical protein
MCYYWFIFLCKFVRSVALSCMTSQTLVQDNDTQTQTHAQCCWVAGNLQLVELIDAALADGGGRRCTVVVLE